jgi:hypothetical protein
MRRHNAAPIPVETLTVSLRWLLLLSAAWLACFPVSARAAEPLIRHLEPAQLLLQPGKHGERTLELRLPGRVLSLQLSPHRSLLQRVPAAVRQNLSGRGFQPFRGQLKEVPGSWVRLHLYRGQWQGAWFDGEMLHLLDPVAAVKGLGTAPRGAAYVVYRLDDVWLQGMQHDEAEAPSADLYWRELPGLAVTASKAGLRELSLTVVTDTEFSALHGNDRDSVVAGRLNVIDGIYSEQLQVRVALGHLQHLDANGSLSVTDGSTLLSTFRSYMNSGDGSAIPKGGLSHLFSGKDFDGNTAGVAYVGTLCSSSSGYGVNQVRGTSAVTAVIVAHEMGHNFGARHDGQSGSPCAGQTGSWLMSPSVSGSQTRFSQCSLDTILPRIATAGCLRSVISSSGFYGDGFED